MVPACRLTYPPARRLTGRVLETLLSPPPPPAWSWGGSLTATPDALAAGGLQCLLTGLQGLLLHHRGGS